MHRFLPFLLLFATPILPAAISQAAHDLLRDAEIARGVIPQTGLEWTVEAASETTELTENATMLVRTQYGRALAEVVAPDSSRGKKYLLADGSMYFYRPGTSRAVAVPARQQVAGDAAIGDIASTGFLVEYNPDNITPGSFQGERCAVLQLVAKPDALGVYSRIVLWISETERVIRKAEFFTMLGRKIRSAYFFYESELNLEERTYPFLSQLKVVQELGQTKTTTLTFSNHQLKSFPPTIFQRATLADDKPNSFLNLPKLKLPSF